MSKYSDKFKNWKQKKDTDKSEAKEVEGEVEIKRTDIDFQAALEKKLSESKPTEHKKETSDKTKKETSDKTEKDHKEKGHEHHMFSGLNFFHHKKKQTGYMKDREDKWKNLKNNATAFGHIKHQGNDLLEQSKLDEKQKLEKKSKLTKRKVDEKKKAIKHDVFKALKKKKRVKVLRRKQLRFFLNRAGYEHIDDIKLKKTVLYKIPIIILTIASLLTLLVAILKSTVSILYASFFIIVGLWVLGYALILIIEFLGIYAFLDNRTYSRKKEMEAVLADFLQLTSSNISAGMPVDRALWFAVRPKFGVLAKEIEEVAKATLTGEDLGKALKKFASKFDSVILTRSINLLLEGMEGGGEIADLLNKIALNIQEIRIMKKQMAADVLTYVIFITFASIVIAPFLFALSTQLLNVVTTIMGNIGDSSTGGGMLSIGGESKLKTEDFQIFVYTMLGISSILSSLIIATIQSGVPRDGWKKVPGSIAVSYTLYYLGNMVFSSLMSSMF